MIGKEKKYFGVMLDVSSNFIMKPQKVKEFALYLKKLGYNAIQLYTEDVYEVDNEPYFGYMRGRYSKKELKDIVSYCDGIGIEVIPCIQTLAHLRCIFRWKEYDAINDCDDILLIDDERTYQLIENMFVTLKECFTSTVVNIGLDEAHRMGLGKYLRKHGYTDRLKLFFKHICRVKDIARKYGFEPTMWSDLIYELIDGGYYTATEEQIEEIKADFPSDVGLIYWQYFHPFTESYDRDIARHKQLSDEVWFAGAVHTYIGFTPMNDMADDKNRMAMLSCKNNGINKILITLWGAGNCSYFLALPALCYARCTYEGITDENVIAKRFNDAIGEDYYQMRSLDKSSSGGVHYEALPEITFNRYILFQDVFCNVFDPALENTSVTDYIEYSEKFTKLAKTSKFPYLYETQAKLLKVLYHKYKIGMDIRSSYTKKNLQKLRTLSNKLIQISEEITDFYKAFKTQWYLEGKQNGIEVEDIHFGGLILRTKNCAELLKKFADGEIDQIDELEEDLLHYNGLNDSYSQWNKIVTVNHF